MPSFEKHLDGSILVTADDGVTLIVAAGTQAVQDSAIQTFLNNHIVVVALPSNDPQIISALQGVTLAKALKWLVNKRVLTLDDLT